MITYKRDNRIIVDLNKCQFARFYYRNQSGQTRNTRPAVNTYGNKLISNNELACFHPDYPGETMIERYERRGIMPDVWIPEVLFKLTANHCLIYTGDKALEMYKTWCTKIFKGSNKSSKRKK